MLISVLLFCFLVSIVLVISNDRYHYDSLDLWCAVLNSAVIGITLAGILWLFSYMYYSPTIAAQYPEEYKIYTDARLVLEDYEEVIESGELDKDTQAVANALVEYNDKRLTTMEEKLSSSKVMSNYTKTVGIIVLLSFAIGYVIGIGNLIKDYDNAVNKEMKKKLYIGNDPYNSGP